MGPMRKMSEWFWEDIFFSSYFFTNHHCVWLYLSKWEWYALWMVCCSYWSLWIQEKYSLGKLNIAYKLWQIVFSKSRFYFQKTSPFPHILHSYQVTPPSKGEVFSSPLESGQARDCFDQQSMAKATLCEFCEEVTETNQLLPGSPGTFALREDSWHLGGIRMSNC